jgi:chromosome segregation ATPase
MEHERQTLIEARQELADQIQASKEMLMNLENAKSSLVQDLQNKRHSMRIDRSCLTPGKLKSGSTQDRLVLPSLQDVPNYGQPPSPKDAPKMSGMSHEESRMMDARQLIQAAIHLEEDAMRLCNASDAAMIHTQKECTRAINMALAALARRVDETDELKKKLESQLRETDETIVQTEISLGKTKKKLDSHEVPLNALDKQFHMRNRRTPAESIRDNVQEELESHLDSVKKSVKALTNKFQSTKDVLEQLKSSKLRMVEDHRSKLAALKIDDACLKVTPRKAIELDRMDPRGGRCMKPAGVGKRPGGGLHNHALEAGYSF